MVETWFWSPAVAHIIFLSLFGSICFFAGFCFCALLSLRHVPKKREEPE
jgi:hypothetical protein